VIWAAIVRVAQSLKLLQYFQDNQQDLSNIPVNYSRFIGALICTFEVLLDVYPAEIEALVQDMQTVFIPPNSPERVDDKMVQLLREYKDLFPYAYMFNRRSGKYPKSASDVVNRYYKMRLSLNSNSLGSEEDDNFKDEGDDDTLGDSFTPEHFPDLLTPTIMPLKPFSQGDNSQLPNNSRDYSDAVQLSPNTASALLSAGNRDINSAGQVVGMNSGGGIADSNNIPYTPDGASILDAYYSHITTANQSLIEEDEEDSDQDHPYFPQRKPVRRVTRMKQSSASAAGGRRKLTRRRPYEDELIASNTSANANISVPQSSSHVHKQLSGNNNNNNTSSANVLRASVKTVTFAANNEYQDHNFGSPSSDNIGSLSDENRSEGSYVDGQASISLESDDAIAYLAKDTMKPTQSSSSAPAAYNNLLSSNRKTENPVNNDVEELEENENPANQQQLLQPSWKQIARYSKHNTLEEEDDDDQYEAHQKPSSNTVVSSAGTAGDEVKGGKMRRKHFVSGHESDSSLELSDGGGNASGHEHKHHSTEASRKYHNPLNATLEEEEFRRQRQQQPIQQKTETHNTRVESESNSSIQTIPSVRHNRYASPESIDEDEKEDIDKREEEDSSRGRSSYRSNDVWASAKPSRMIKTSTTHAERLTQNSSPSQSRTSTRAMDASSSSSASPSVHHRHHEVGNEDVVDGEAVEHKLLPKRKPFSYEVQYDEFLRTHEEPYHSHHRPQHYHVPKENSESNLVADTLNPNIFHCSSTSDRHAVTRDNMRRFKQKQQQKQQQQKISPTRSKSTSEVDHDEQLVPEFLTERRKYLLEQLQHVQEDSVKERGRNSISFPNSTLSISPVMKKPLHKKKISYEEELDADQALDWEEGSTETVAESLKNVSDIRRSLELWRTHYARPEALLQEWAAFWHPTTDPSTASKGDNAISAGALSSTAGTGMMVTASWESQVSASISERRWQRQHPNEQSQPLQLTGDHAQANSAPNPSMVFANVEAEELWHMQQLRQSSNHHSLTVNSLLTEPKPFQDLPPGIHATSTQHVASATTASSSTASNALLPMLTEIAQATGVILEGFLYKKSTKNFINRWKKRYFVLRESPFAFCELCIYGSAVPSAWGMVPLTLKARIPILDVSQVDAVGGIKSPTVAQELVLSFQPAMVADGSPGNKKKGMFSRWFGGSSSTASAPLNSSAEHSTPSNHGNNQSSYLRKSTGSALTAARLSENNHTAQSNSQLPPTVPRRAQSMRWATSTDPATNVAAGAGAATMNWETGSMQSDVSSAQASDESAAAHYYGDVVKEMYLRTETPELRLLWVTTLNKAMSYARDAEQDLLQQELALNNAQRQQQLQQQQQ
jgi:hypothetical protein